MAALLSTPDVKLDELGAYLVIRASGDPKELMPQLHNAFRDVRRDLATVEIKTLSEQLDAEAVSFGACSATTDFAEGITAFLEKRPAEFGK